MSERKTVNIELTCTMPVEVPTDWTKDDVDFWLEGSSFCLGNLIRQEHDRIESKPGLCDFCVRARAHMVEE